MQTSASRALNRGVVQFMRSGGGSCDPAPAGVIGPSPTVTAPVSQPPRANATVLPGATTTPADGLSLSTTGTPRTGTGLFGSVSTDSFRPTAEREAQAWSAVSPITFGTTSAGGSDMGLVVGTVTGAVVVVGRATLAVWSLWSSSAERW